MKIFNSYKISRFEDECWWLFVEIRCRGNSQSHDIKSHSSSNFIAVSNSKNHRAKFSNDGNGQFTLSLNGKYQNQDIASNGKITHKKVKGRKHFWRSFYLQHSNNPHFYFNDYFFTIFWRPFDNNLAAAISSIIFATRHILSTQS